MIKDAKIQIRDVNLFAEISGQTYEDTDELSDVSFTTLVPAFILSELRKAFIMGFLIYIRFHCRLKYYYLYWQMDGIW